MKNINEYEKYLPVGTVVMLKNAKRRLMITGFACHSNEDTKVYDYTGVPYPQGFISSKINLLFNHEQIDKIYHVGPIDNEAKEFNEKLKEVIQKEN